jgi:hypothetical protein
MYERISNPRGYDGVRLSLYNLSHVFAHFWQYIWVEI